MSEIESALYERRRLLTVLFGHAEPPPGALRPLLGGVAVAVLMAGVEAARRLW